MMTAQLPLQAPFMPAGDPFAATAIAFEGVTKRYAGRGSVPGVVALSDVGFEATQGSITGIIGRSGAGKSTLVRLVSGLEAASEGRVIVEGVDITRLSGEALRARQRRIGMIFQHFNLLSSRTAAENVALPLELAGQPRDGIKRRVDELLDLVGLADKRGAYPAALSGGQKQRVGIARALAAKPAVLLSDEATSALDPETTAAILDLLRRVNAVTGVTILLITHEMEVVKAVADRVVVLDGGKVVEKGAVQEVFARPRTETARRFVASVAGSPVPEDIAIRLVAQSTFASRAVIRVTFTGPNATAPILSRLSRTLDIDVNILSGRVDAIGSEPFGSLVVSIPARDDIVGAAVTLIRIHGLDAELLGHVA